MKVWVYSHLAGFVAVIVFAVLTENGISCTRKTYFVGDLKTLKSVDSKCFLPSLEYPNNSKPCRVLFYDNFDVVKEPLKEISYEYDKVGNITKWTLYDFQNKVKRFTYSKTIVYNNNKLAIYTESQDSNGGTETTSIKYDRCFRPKKIFTSRKIPNKTDKIYENKENRIKYSYSFCGERCIRIDNHDFNQKVTFMYYNVYGFITKYIENEGTDGNIDYMDKYYYSETNKNIILKKKETDFNGDGIIDDIVFFEYDELGRLVKSGQDVDRDGRLESGAVYDYDNCHTNDVVPAAHHKVQVNDGN